MNPKSTLRSFLSIASSAVLTISYAQATNLYWDVNGAGTAGFSTVVGAWNGTNQFWNDSNLGSTGTVIAVPTSGDDLFISQATTNTGSITISGATKNASSITFLANVGPTTTITGGIIIIGGTGTSSGIFQQSTGGNAISSALQLNSANTAFNFTNSSSGGLTIGAVTGTAASGTQTITVGSSSSGNITLNGVIADVSGSATKVALTVNSLGVGVTTLSGANTYTGKTTLSAGTLSINSIQNAGSVTANALGRPAAGADSIIDLAATGTLRYTGTGHSSDRVINLTTAAGGNFTLDASGASGTFALTGGVTNAGTSAISTLALTGTGLGSQSGAIVNGTSPNVTAVTKSGTGTWALSGTNTYTGITTVNAGTLAIAKQLSLYNNTPASWTAANINVKSGATLALNLDSAGSAGFDSSNLNTLLGNISVATTAAQGLQAGASIGFDTSTATGATFTQGNAITNSTGAFGGLIGVTKLGAGTLVFDKANTYTGPTTISAGTLQLNPGGAIAGPIFNNGTFLVNKPGTLTIGTDFPAFIAGTGSIAVLAGSTITVNAPTALQNTAIDTTGGSFALSGVTTPSFGGLSGAAGDLATVISSGYSGVTNLTLNPASGASYTYGGIIANGLPAGMSLTKTGAGTQILQGNNSYTGATNINAGTLTLSGAAGALASTTINLNGGGLTLDNTTNLGTRVSDSATVNVNGNSALTFSQVATAATSYAETIDTLSLQSGFLTYTGSQAAIGQTSNVLFNTLSRSGATNTSTVNFAGTSLGIDARNTINFGAGVTTATDLGPWAVVNGADFASYSTANGIVTATSSTLAVASSSNSTNWKLTGGNITITNGTNPLYKTLLISDGSARTLTTTGNTVSVGGISSIGQNHVISGTGAVQTLAAGDALYINVGSAATNNALAISSVIQNNTTASSLVKYGAGTLTLSNASNTYSGGTVINAGTVSVTVDGHLGAAGAGITFNGTARLSAPAVVSTRPITINGSSTLATFIGNGIFTTSGDVTGSGGIFLDGGLSAGSDVILNGTGNAFLGPITIGNVLSVGTQQYALTVGSLADSATANGNIILNYQGTRGNGIFGFYYNNASSTSLTLANRQIVLANTGGTPGNNIANNSISPSAFLAVDTNLAVTTPSATSLVLGGTNTGANAFAGIIGNGASTALSLTKNGAGRWTLSGPNTYTGATTVSAGTVVGIGANAFGSTSGISIAGAGTLSLRGNTNTNFVKASDSSPYTVNNSASGSTINVDRVSGTGAATMTIGNLTTTSTAGTWGLNFTGANGVSLSAGALNTPVSTIAATHTITNSITGGGSLTLASVFNQATTVDSPDLVFAGTGTTIVSGAITQTLADMYLFKLGAGTLLLNGSNTYSGVTSVNAGTLGGAGLIAGEVTVAAAGSLAPGAGASTAGTLSIGGVLDLSAPLDGGAGKLNFELGPIANSDKIALTGGASLTIGGNFLDFSDFNFSSLSGLQNGTYKLITSANPISGGLDTTPANLTGPIGAGTGILQITGNDVELLVSGIAGASPYDTWAAGPFTNPFTNSLPGVDFDNDGLSNLLEFVLGGDPTISQAGIAPAVTSSGGNLVMTFKRSDASELAPAVSVKVELSTDLSFSTPADDITIGPVTDAGPIAPSDASYTVTNSGAFDTIVLTLPQGAAPKKFARVKAVQP